MKTITPFILLCAIAHAQNHDTRLMTSAEYKAVLNKVDLAVPEWQAALKRVDPAKSNVSYAVGKQIEKWRDLGLREVTWVSQWTEKEHAKHTVSGELALDGFLDGVFNVMDNVIQTEVAAGVTIPDLDKYLTDTSSLRISIANDVRARVELLENATCP